MSRTAKSPWQESITTQLPSKEITNPVLDIRFVFVVILPKLFKATSKPSIAGPFSRSWIVTIL